MANFQLFKPLLYKQEGFYSNDPADSGGETWRGISRNNYPKWAGWAFVDAHRSDPDFPNVLRGLPLLSDLCDKFYECHEWDTIQADDITNQSIANFLVDWEVNAGIGAPIEHAQILLGLPADGIMGPRTLGALNALREGETFFEQLQQARVNFYRDVVRAHPKDAKFLRNWIDRTMSFRYSA